MNLSDFNSYYLFLSIFISVMLHVVFMKKHIKALIDPWLFMFLNGAMILAVMIYSYLQQLIPNEQFYYIFACWFSFVIGLSIFHRKKIPSFNAPVLLNSKSTGLALKISLILFLINGALIFILMGIPLLSGARTISDYSKMGAGFGILFYINWGLQNLITYLSLKKWLYDGNRKFGLLALFILIVFNILNRNSRSGYLDVIMYITLGMYYMQRNFDIKYKLPKIFYYALIILPFYILYTFVSAVNDGYEANVFLALTKRVIGSAEGPFYYFNMHSFTYFKGLNLFSYHFSQILPYFGYVDKEAINLGVNLSLESDLSFGTQGYGANPTMFVIGHIAWGNWGFLYCFLIGTFLSYLRYQLKTTFFVWITLNITAISLVGDGTLMPLTLFYLLLLSPILLISILLSDNTKTLTEQKQNLPENKIVFL